MKILLGALCLLFLACFVSSQNAPQYNLTKVTGVTNGTAGVMNSFTIQLVDANGNPTQYCPGSNNIFSVALSGPTNIIGSFATCQKGAIRASWIGTLAGQYTLTVTAQGFIVLNNPNIWVLAAQIYPPLSTAAGNLNGGVVGQTFLFNITARDQYGNINPGCTPGVWIISLTSGGSTSSGTVQSTCPAPGVYNVNYSPKVKGSWSMVVGMQGSYIKGSPFLVTMTAGSFYPKNAVVSQIGPIVEAGSVVTFTVTAYDQYNNQITTCDSTLQWNNNVTLNGQTVATIPAPVCQGGVYVFSFRDITLASPNYQVLLTVNGTNVASSPYPLIVVAASQISAKDCEASGPGLTNGVAGLPSLINITAYDVYGNPITSCDAAIPENFLFTLTSVSDPSLQCPVGSGQTCVKGDSSSGIPAVFQGDWYCYKATNYNLVISYGTDQFNQTYQPSVIPGILSGPASNAFGPGTEIAYAGEQSLIYVDPFDQYDNAIPNCDSTYFVGSNFTVTVTNNDGGVIYGYFNSCVLTPSGPNITLFYELNSIFNTDLQVDYNGQNLNNGTFSVITYPGLPYPGKCNSSGSGLDSATAGTKGTFSVQCTDKFDNPIVDCAPPQDWYLNLTLSTGDENVLLHAVNCTPVGPYAVTVFEFNLTEAGNYNLDYGYLNDSTLIYYSLDDDHSVSIIAGPLDIANTAALGYGIEGQNISAGSNVSFQIVARDSFNNPVQTCLNVSSAGLTLLFNPPITNPPYIIGCDPASNNYNVVVYYNTTVATVYNVDINYQGSPIHNSPYHPRWIAGPINAGSVVAYGDGLDGAVAGEVAEIYLNSTDIYGNVVTTCDNFNPDDWTYVLNNINVSGVTPITGNADHCHSENGIVVITYIATIAGYYNVSIQYNNVDINLDPNHRTPLIVAADANATTSYVFGPGYDPNTYIVAGSQQTFYILPRDSYGNNVTDCSADFGFYAEFTTVNNNTNGQIAGDCNATTGYYPVTYTQTLATQWNIQVYGDTNDEPVNGESSITVVPAAISSPDSFAYQKEGDTGLTAGQTINIVLILNDKYSNPITNCSYSNTSLWDIWAQLDTNNSVKYYAGDVSCPNGVFTAQYSVQQFGDYHVKLYYGGVPLANSSFPVSFVAGAVDASQSYAVGLGVDGNSNVAGNSVSFLIYAVNQYGIAITDGSLCSSFNLTDWSVSFNQSFVWNTTTNTTTDVTGCDPIAGTFSGSYLPTKAGRYSINIALKQQAINKNPYQPRVVPGPIYPPNTIITGLNETKFWGDNGTFYIQARDIYMNNEFSADSSNFNVSLTPACTNTSVVLSNAPGGQVRADWSVTEGGIYCVIISYDGAFFTLQDASIHALGGTGCNGTNSCNLQGYCFRNTPPSTSDARFSCNCFQGYTGDDCSVKIHSKYPLTVGAIIGLVVGLGILMFLIGLLLGFCVLRCLRTRSDRHSLLD